MFETFRPSSQVIAKLCFYFVYNTGILMIQKWVLHKFKLVLGHLKARVSCAGERWTKRNWSSKTQSPNHEADMYLLSSKSDS